MYLWDYPGCLGTWDYNYPIDESIELMLSTGAGLSMLNCSLAKRIDLPVWNLCEEKIIRFVGSESQWILCSIQRKEMDPKIHGTSIDSHPMRVNMCEFLFILVPIAWSQATHVAAVTYARRSNIYRASDQPRKTKWNIANWC